MEKLVTKESFTALISRRDEVGKKAIGRALVHLMNRQTEVEKQILQTNEHNLVGFTQADARSGVISARYFLRHGTLEKWQVDRWLKKNKNGVPRLAKYWMQINEEANKLKEKRATIVMPPEVEAEYNSLKDEFTLIVDSDMEPWIKPIVTRIREIEKQYGLEPYTIMGSIYN
jgi:hypothetical protein